MKAELTDGTIIELEQDCGCITHTGPHWIHMDAIDKWLNNALIKESLNPLHIQEIARLELARLEAKRRNMIKHGIVRIIKETEDENS